MKPFAHTLEKKKMAGESREHRQLNTYFFVCNYYIVSNSCIFVNYTIPAYEIRVMI
jgi:hypothetical protein